MTFSALAAIAAALFVGLASPASAQNVGDGDQPAGFVDVVEVSGLLDPVLADFIEEAVANSTDDGARWIVLQVNSTGAVISDARLVELARFLAESPIPIGAWVGPSGSKAEGEMAQLLSVVDDLGLASGSRIGDLGEQVVPIELVHPDRVAGLADLTSTTVEDERAAGLGVARSAPVLGNFLVALDGFEVEIEATDDGQQTVPVTQVRFGGLPLIDEGFHTMASPPVAYLLFLIGMGLLLFELYTAGVGIAGGIGALSLIGGCYGLDVLPARWWAVALLVFSMFGFAVDVQVGVPRVWTGVGTAALIGGSLFLYDGVSMSWIALLTGIVGMVLAMVSGMPAMVRTRFSTPTIGRDWMIGELGLAIEAVDPDGVVSIRDAAWRARTNRATPIAAGDPVRVVAIDGLLLEVEPEVGGARDYRH